MRRMELMGRPSFSTACKRDRPSKYAHLTSSPSTGSIISRYVAFHISLHVASLILLTHELPDVPGPHRWPLFGAPRCKAKQRVATSTWSSRY